MELVKLAPAVKDYIWGGTYFKAFNKGVSLERVSECWELSLRDADSSIIASGKDKGKLLVDVIFKEDVGPIQDRFKYRPCRSRCLPGCRDTRDRQTVRSCS